jgi:alkylated DNA nucleotide flippase Atl1
LGKPEAFRAVASANGMNRIAIIIPCHRVIGEDGNLTGYAGGLARKKWLLDHVDIPEYTDPRTGDSDPPLEGFSFIKDSLA